MSDCGVSCLEDEEASPHAHAAEAVNKTQTQRVDYCFKPWVCHHLGLFRDRSGHVCKAKLSSLRTLEETFRPKAKQLELYERNHRDGVKRRRNPRQQLRAFTQCCASDWLTGCCVIWEKPVC